MSFTVPISGVPTDVSFAVTKDNLVAVGTYETKIELINTDQRKVVSIKDFSGSPGDPPLPQVMTFTVDGNDRLLTAFDDSSIVMYDVEKGFKKIKQFQNEGTGTAANCIVVVDENVFVIGGVDGDVRSWDTRVGSHPVLDLTIGTDQISDMILSPDENSVFCVTGDGILATIKLRGGVVAESEAYDTTFTSLGTYRDDTKLAVGAENGRIYIFDWGKFSYHSDMFKPHKSPINVMIPVTEQIGILGYEDGTIRAFNFFPHKPVGIVGQHPSMVERMDISSNGRTLVTGAHEEELRFWDIGFLEDVGATSSEVEGQPRGRDHLPSSNSQNKSEFFSGLGDDSDSD